MSARKNNSDKRAGRGRRSKADPAEDEGATGSGSATGDVDDTQSVASVAQSASSSAGKNAEVEELTPEEKQEQLIEQLGEKRSSTRLSALARLIEQLQQSFVPDFVAGRLETLQLYLLNSIRKGDTSEVQRACRALQLTVLTLGPGNETEHILQAATPILRDYLKNTAKNAGGRAAVAECLAFIHFIASLCDVDTIAAMDMLTDVLGRGAAARSSAGNNGAPLPEAIATGCLEGWGLLASTLSTSRLGGPLLEQSMPLLRRFLDDESVDVKTAAGESIALLIEAKQQLEADRAEYSGSSSSSVADEDAPVEERKQRPAAAAASSSSDSALDHDSLIAQLSSLSTESSRSRGKKERAVQRKFFRDILATVEAGDVPEESLKIEKSRHTFSGWVSVVQLQAVRDVLAGGLNVHFVHNTLLAEIFDLEIEAGEGVDDPARKAASRAQSRAKALENFQHRQKQRKKKHALKNQFSDE